MTTDWVIIGFAPIIPICTLRVRHKSRAGLILPVIYNSDTYDVFEKRRPYLKQVLFVYGFVLGMSAWIFTLSRFYNSFARWVGETAAAWLFFGAYAAPAAVPVVLRVVARRTLQEAKPQRPIEMLIRG
jgi:hypothetical protein